MTMTTAILLAVLTAASPQPQPPAFKPSANPVSDVVREQAKRAAANLVASAELMPPDKYGFHPTEPQMTFGQLVVHVVQTNMALCSGIAGTPSPLQPEELMKLSAAQPKEALVGLTKRSFDFCVEALSKVTDAGLADEIRVFGRPSGQSRAAAMVTIAADWADHYSTAASYLRQNGILPPTARPAK
jgi:DinB superfamily